MVHDGSGAAAVAATCGNALLDVGEVLMLRLLPSSARVLPPYGASLLSYHAYVCMYMSREI